MKKEEKNLVIEKSLSDSLGQDTKWQKAYEAAKKIFAIISIPHSGEEASGLIDFVVVSDFLKACNSQDWESFSGNVSLKEAMDDIYVILELNFKPSKGKDKKLEVLFAESGLIFHAAII